VGLLQETGVQLITAAIAFLLGVLLSRILRAWAYIRARKFWRPLIRRDLAIVLGDGFRDLPSFEASQLVAQGDLVASFELNAHFTSMGIRQLRPIFADKTIGVEPDGRGLRRNFIVIGGEDTNTLTDECLKRLKCSYKLVWPNDTAVGRPPTDQNMTSQLPAGKRDIGPKAASAWGLPKLIPATHREHDGLDIYQPVEENDEIVRDYGIIVRARNPFISEGRRNKRVVLIFGCYGFGSLAATLSQERKNFSNKLPTRKRISNASLRVT
jgi:hypothetical protein